MDYLIDKYETDKNLYGKLNNDHENWIGEGSNYHFYMEKILYLKMIVLSQKPMKTIFGVGTYNIINLFIDWCHNITSINALNKFDISGLYALCNQSDCEGFYSPGNAMDICCLFDKIEPFVKKYNCYSCIYNNENRLYDVFKHSYMSGRKIIIS